MMNWERLLAHRHWININIFGRELHLCARCSGTVLGFIGLETVLKTTAMIHYSIPFYSCFLFSLLLALPTILDWITQNSGFRQSNNNLRFITGFLGGMGVRLLGLADIPLTVQFLTVVTVGLLVMSLGFFGRRLCQKN